MIVGLGWLIEVWSVGLPVTAATTAAKRPQWVDGNKSPKPIVQAVMSVNHNESLTKTLNFARKIKQIQNHKPQT